MWNTSQVLAEDEHGNDAADALANDDFGHIGDDEAMRKRLQEEVEADICKKLRRSIEVAGTKQKWVQDVTNQVKPKKKKGSPLKFRRSMTEVRNTKMNSCRCEKADSCHYHRNGGEVTTWCYVDPESIPNCASEDIELMQDQRGRVWSAHLCEKAGCRCKHMGMQPSPDTKLNKSIDALKCSNGECDYMNYVSSCQTWREGDLHAWCFVGWDTTCTDRAREKAPDSSSVLDWPADLHEYMFESKLACPRAGEIDSEETHKGARLFEAKEMCNRAVLGFQIFSCLQFTLAFLMVVIVYLFISNHCADDVSIEEADSFYVRSDEESEDEWQDESSKKEELPRRARHSTTDSFTAGRSFHSR